MNIINKVVDKTLILFFPIIMVDYYLIMRGININNYIILPIIFVLFIGSIVYFKVGDISIGFKLYTLWIAQSMFSIVLYAFNGLPLECYSQAIKQCFFPMLFFIFGYTIRNDYSFYKTYLYSCAFCFVIGLYLYLFTPPYYLQFLVDIKENTWYFGDNILDEDLVVGFTRFSSFFTSSYSISFFSIPAIAISLGWIIRKENNINRAMLSFFLFLSVASAILSMQRIAMFFAVVLLILYSFYGYINKAKRVLLFTTLILIIITSILFFLSDNDRFVLIYDMLSDRLAVFNISDAMSVRTNQYKDYGVFDNLLRLIFGSGMGSAGAFAGRLGYSAIYDGEFVKLLVEYGIFGLLVFVSLLLLTIYKMLKNYKYLHIEFGIISFYVLSCIGANSLSMFFYSIMFWFAMGMVWNKKYLIYLKSNYEKQRL